MSNEESCKDLKLADFWIKDLKVVDINDVRPNDWNFNSMDEQKYESLLENIKRTWYKQFVHVFEDPEAEWKYIIADWEHRWRAMREIWYDKILVMVLALDKTEAMLDTVSSNMIHWDPVAIKMAEVLVELEKSFSRDELAKLTWLTEKEIIEHEEMLEMPNDFDDGLDMEDAPELPVSLTVYMMPWEYENFNKWIEACMNQMEDTWPKAFYSIWDQIWKLDWALKNAQEVANTKNRSVALELLSMVFLDIQKTNPEKIEDLVKELELKRKK